MGSSRACGQQEDRGTATLVLRLVTPVLVSAAILAWLIGM
jgi:hypothetical protein